MATPLDTFDPVDGYPGGIHPRYKQIVAERLAYSGLNVAYGLQEFPLYGPYPYESFQDGSIVTIEYDKEIDFLDAEISGFHFCAESVSDCDEGNSQRGSRERTFLCWEIYSQ